MGVRPTKRQQVGNRAQVGSPSAMPLTSYQAHVGKLIEDSTINKCFNCALT